MSLRSATPAWPRLRCTVRCRPTCSAPATCWPLRCKRGCRRWCAPQPAKRCGPGPRMCTPPPSARPSGSRREPPPAAACWSAPAGSPTWRTTRSSAGGCASGPGAAPPSGCTARTSSSTSSRRVSPRSCSCWPAAAPAERQRVGAQSHDDARFRLGERYREPAGVAAHQVELQAGQLVVRDAHFAELAEAGVDAVDGEAIFGDAAYDIARGVHLGDGGGVDLNADGGVRDGGDFVQRKRLTAELQHSVGIITRDGRFLNRESSVEFKYGH